MGIPILIPLGCEWKGNYPDCEDIFTTTPNVIGETTTTLGDTTTSSFRTSNQDRVKVETSFHRFSGIKDDFATTSFKDNPNCKYFDNVVNKSKTGPLALYLCMSDEIVLGAIP